MATTLTMKAARSRRRRRAGQEHTCPTCHGRGVLPEPPAPQKPDPRQLVLDELALRR